MLIDGACSISDKHPIILVKTEKVSGQARQLPTVRFLNEKISLSRFPLFQRVMKKGQKRRTFFGLTVSLIRSRYDNCCPNFDKRQEVRISAFTVCIFMSILIHMYLYVRSICIGKRKCNTALYLNSPQSPYESDLNSEINAPGEYNTYLLLILRKRGHTWQVYFCRILTHKNFRCESIICLKYFLNRLLLSSNAFFVCRSFSSAFSNH